MISYRTVLLAAIGVVVLLLVGLQLGAPGLLVRATGQLNRWLAGTPPGGLTPQADAATAHFVNIEGAVLVKSRGATGYRPASLDTALGAGDSVETQSNAWARIEFPDDTTYLLSPSSLIVIEEDRVSGQSSQVRVAVDSGAVKLTTGRLDASHASGVRFADAAAALTSSTRARVAAAAAKDGKLNASLTVYSGGAAVSRGGQRVQVQPYQQVDVVPGASLESKPVPMAPQLLAPGNLSPVLSADAAREKVDFSWTAVPGSQRYIVRVSRSPLMSQPFIEQAVAATHWSQSGWTWGSYYWTVSSVDAGGREETSFEPNKFTLMRASAAAHLPVKIDRVTQLGLVLEIRGHTLPGAKILVNNDLVSLIAADGSFQYVTPAYAKPGSYPLTITAEDSQGRVTTLHQQVTLR